MKMQDFERKLKKYGFLEKGTIIKNTVKKHLEFKFVGSSSKDDYKGNVYMWVRVFENTITEILYIGKAGKTLKDRCNQHVAGFKKSKRGKELAKKIVKEIKSGAVIVLYSRYSERKEILGENDISLCSVEEIALINKFTPSYNPPKNPK
jgi:hypothetical protein